MKAIQLTNEQEEKLLEMSKKLFPEYDDIYWNSGKGSNGSHEHLGFGKQKGKYIEYEYIHWFEFIMLYFVSRLQDVLSEKFGYDSVLEPQPPYVANVQRWKKGDKWNLYCRFMFHYPKACFGGSNTPRNPIDYLYKEYKQIK